MRAARLVARGDVGALPPSWPRALTVVIVGNHVAVPIVGGQKGLRRRLCGEGRQWAQSPWKDCPRPPAPSYRSSPSPLGPRPPAPGAPPSPRGARARASRASSCWGAVWASSGAGCTRLGERVAERVEAAGLGGVPRGVIRGPPGQGLDLDGVVGPVVAGQLGSYSQSS